MKIYYTLLIVLTTTLIVKGQNTDLDLIAKKYLSEFKVPGLAVSVIKSDTIHYGVAGVKRSGSSEEINLESKFQIASNTKAITATVAALIVKEGKIKWSSRIIDVVPQLAGEIRKEYYDISLEDLLSNRGLVKPFEEDDSEEWKGLPSTIISSNNSKLEFAKYALNLNPTVNSEKEHSYSNGGFIIAALMLEESTGLTWGELIEKLNMEYEINAFIGFPNQESATGTYGHKKSFGKYKPVSAKDELHFDFDFSGAGNLSIGLEDFTHFINQHLKGLLGNDNILTSTTYHQLHYGHENYSLGWYNGYIGETKQKFSYHGGSLGTFSSAVMLSADREVAIIILVNSDDKKTTELKNKLREELWKKYGS